MGDPIEVAAAIIERAGKVLIAERAGGHLKGKWELPGGKVKPGETPEDCLKREVKEELGARVAIGGLFAENEHDYGERGVVKLRSFRCTLLSGEPEKNREVHSDLRWVAILDLPGFDFAPADIPIVDALVQHTLTLAC